jgi:hypothetical protein
MRISCVLSKTAYTVRDEKSGQEFDRTVSNINPYRPSVIESGTVITSRGDSKVPMVGDMIAVLEDDVIWLAQVLRLDADLLECHYWATTSDSKNAVFKPAFIGSSTGKTILTYKLRANEEPTIKWTGSIPMGLLVSKVTFRVDKKGMHRLSNASRRLLSNYVLAKL